MAKETINKMERQPTEWEKIFASEVTDRTNLQNIQTAHTALCLKKKKKIQKKKNGQNI